MHQHCQIEDNTTFSNSFEQENKIDNDCRRQSHTPILTKKGEKNECKQYFNKRFCKYYTAKTPFGKNFLLVFIKVISTHVKPQHPRIEANYFGVAFIRHTHIYIGRFPQ